MFSEITFSVSWFNTLSFPVQVVSCPVVSLFGLCPCPGCVCPGCVLSSLCHVRVVSCLGYVPVRVVSVRIVYVSWSKAFQ